MRRLILLWVIAASSAAAQPAQGPSGFELVTEDGARQHLATSYVRNISLLHSWLESRELRMERGRLRLFCTRRCPAELDNNRPRTDAVYWRDGRRTNGAVFLYRGIIEQNGRRAGRLEDVDRIELGSANLNPALAASLRPGVVDVSGGVLSHPSEVSGEYVVFREPWLTLTNSLLAINGRQPMPRSDVRFLSHSGQRTGHFADPRSAADLVVWNDGSRTMGAVRISQGRVRQPGRPPRPFIEVQYIELSPGGRRWERRGRLGSAR